MRVPRVLDDGGWTVRGRERESWEMNAGGRVEVKRLLYLYTMDEEEQIVPGVYMCLCEWKRKSERDLSAKRTPPLDSRRCAQPPAAILFSVECYTVFRRDYLAGEIWARPPLMCLIIIIIIIVFLFVRSIQNLIYIYLILWHYTLCKFISYAHSGTWIHRFISKHKRFFVYLRLI